MKYAVIILLALLAGFLIGIRSCQDVPDPIHSEDPALLDSIQRMNDHISDLKDDVVRIRTEVRERMMAVIDTMQPEEVVRYVIRQIQPENPEEQVPEVDTFGRVCYTTDQNTAIAKRLKELEVIKIEVKTLDQLVEKYEDLDSANHIRIHALKESNIKLAQENAKLQRRLRRRQVFVGALGILTGLLISSL